MTNFTRIALPVCLAGLGVSAPLLADSGFSEQMVVTAHRSETPLQRVGSAISTFSAEDIEARGQVAVADLLRSVPGVAVSNSGGYGKQTALRIRGEESYRTVVYLDGVKLSDTTATQLSTRFAHLLTSEVERIEVLRGPQGMMYGADAGGVINIFSRRATAPLEGGISAEAGRYDTLNLSANLRGRQGGFDYSLSASDFSSNGFNARSSDSVDSDDDGYDNTTLHGRFGLDLSDALRLQLVLRSVDGENHYDGSFGSHDRSNDYQQDLGKLSASYRQGDLSHQLSLSRSRVQRQEFQQGAPVSWGGRYLGILDQAGYQGLMQIDPGHSLLFGIDLEEQRDEQNGNEQDQAGFYLELQGQLGDNVYYSAGVRHDDNDAFGEHTSYRLTAAVVQPLGEGDYLKYKASAGNGFRAPSLYEQWYNTSSGWAYGAAAATTLEEERSEGFDAGVEFHSRHGHVLEVVAFYTEIEDAIDFDQESWSGYLQLEGTSRSRGVELNAELQLGERLQLLANATYNDTSDAEGDQRARRPRRVFNLGLQSLLWQDRLRLNADLRGSYSAIDNSGDELGGYEVLSLNATWFAGRGLELFLRGENVLDEDYREISDFNTAGASVYGGLRLKF